ncbi:MAG: peptidylprolyl isomerase, partial [Planctomycetaceae bacterium]
AKRQAGRAGQARPATQIGAYAMSEGTHSTPQSTARRRRMVVLVAGTAVALLAAAVALQMFRAEEGNAEVQVGPQTAGSAAVSDGQGTDMTVARVGKQIIHYDTLAQECVERYGRDVLEKIINRTIIMQACQDRGIVITEAEVNQEIVHIAKKFNLTPDNWFAMLQTERNITPMQYKRDIIWPMLALKKLAGTDVSVSDDELRKAFIRDYGPRVEAKMIMFGKLRHAEDVWKTAVENPDEFSRLARLHSIEPNSRALNGAIPPIHRYTGQPELEKSAFELQPGEISGIIHVGPSQYVILKCEGHTKPTVTDIEEVREILHEQILEEKVQASVAQVFEQLKEETRVINYVTNQTTGGVQQTSGTESPAAARPARQAPPQQSARPSQTRRQ